MKPKEPIPGKSKITSLQMGEDEIGSFALALCDDGTLWQYRFWKHSYSGPWEKFEGLPE